MQEKQIFCKIPVMHLTTAHSIDPSLEKLLCKEIISQAHIAKKMSPFEPFEVALRDADNILLGGAYGITYYGCLYTDMLWIPSALRGQGWGTKIMLQAEQVGKERHCSFATVNTMDWEALPFYQKLGYTIEFVREGYDKNSKKFHLKKILH